MSCCCEDLENAVPLFLHLLCHQKLPVLFIMSPVMKKKFEQDSNISCQLKIIWTAIKKEGVKRKIKKIFCFLKPLEGYRMKWEEQFERFFFFFLFSEYYLKHKHLLTATDTRGANVVFIILWPIFQFVSTLELSLVVDWFTSELAVSFGNVELSTLQAGKRAGKILPCCAVVTRSPNDSG